MTRPSALGFLLALVTAGCAAIPEPRVLDEVDAISRSPAAAEAKSFAAPTWAMAEKLRLEAHEAVSLGPAASAQFLAEESIATYSQAASLARVAKATVREQEALANSESVDAELKKTEADLARATAEVEALEQRLRTARALLASSGPDTPERAAERRVAARETVVQGRLLCSAARLLGAGAGAAADSAGKDADAAPTSAAALARDLAQAEAQLAEVDRGLETPDDTKPAGKAPSRKPAAPRDELLNLAIGGRAKCLAVLSRTRRAPESAKASAQGASSGRSADALLGEISAMAASSKQSALSPGRDERGVVVTLRSVFDGESLSSAAKARLEELDRVAGQHPAFPIAVVVHSEMPITKAEKPKWEARAAAIAAAFKSVDKTRRMVLLAGDAVSLSPASERAADARVEIVFIAPEAL